MSEALEALAAAAGLISRYHDGAGQWREAPPESIRAVLGALGLSAETDADAADCLHRLQDARSRRRLPEWAVVRADDVARFAIGDGESEWRLECFDGEIRDGRATHELDLGHLPLGRHRLVVGDSVTTILAAPERLPEPPRTWGVTLPLYGLKPERGGGRAWRPRCEFPWYQSGSRRLSRRSAQLQSLRSVKSPPPQCVPHRDRHGGAARRQ